MTELKAPIIPFGTGDVRMYAGCYDGVWGVGLGKNNGDKTIGKITIKEGIAIDKELYALLTFTQVASVNALIDILCLLKTRMIEEDSTNE